MKMFRKNLCDKVSKMKNLRLLSSSFFRADRRGILRFFGGRIVLHQNVILLIKLTKIWRFCFAIFSVKNASTEKTEYTMTKSTKKRRR